MKKTSIAILLVLMATIGNAQTQPVINSWIRNTNGATGYNGIESNVQIVQYSDSNVYISCTCIPGYSIGPWMGSPATPSNQNFVFKITRYPKHNTATPVTINGGHIGVLTNGVSIFNAQDANTYNNDGVWHQNGYVFEYPSFDNCIGHPQQQGEYHHHVSPKCLYDQTDSLHHSPIIGYAFDGFPIYGAYGYADTNGNGGIKRMVSSYHLRSITTRTTLPDGSAASATGPPVNSQYPLGNYLEDYVYTTGFGDLDAHNGRYCVTPEYPQGTYAYFMTLDSTLKPAYPYTLGVSYYGTVQPGNTDVTGPGTSGHNTINETTTIYNGTSGINDINNNILYQVTPNPVVDYAFIQMDANSSNNLQGKLYNMNGELVQTIHHLQPSITYAMDMRQLPEGTYLLYVQGSGKSNMSKIIKVGK